MLSNLFMFNYFHFTKFENSQSRTFSTYKINPTKLESYSLVPYGSNLSSNVGYPKFNKLTSGQIFLPPHIKGAVIGLILSDAWISFSNAGSKNARLGFKQTFPAH